jgi:hypothetical protein
MSKATSSAVAPGAKGQLVVGNGVNTAGIVAVGANGTVLVADSAEATGVKWATPAGGKVLQVVQATTSSEVTVSSTTYTDTGLTATITPSSATSKILVLTSQASRATLNGIEEAGLVTRIVRGSTAIFNDSNNNMNLRLQINNITATMSIATYLNYTFLDTPATTSAITYKTQGAARTNNGTAIFQFGGTMTSTITLLEIGA